MIASLRTIASRIRGLFTGQRLDSDFEQEIESHLALLTEENIRTGMAPGEAARAARLKLGGAVQLRESHHDQLTFGWLESLAQDVRFAMRMLRKNPGFTVVAVLTLALGIGANTAIFSLIDAALLRPLPFPQSAKIVQPTRDYKGVIAPAISAPLFEYWNQHNEAFTHLAAYSFLPEGFNLAERGLPERVMGTSVSADFFQVLGVNAEFGRTFVSEEDRPGTAPVAIISYGLWKTRFAASPNLVGRTITVDGEPRTVIGIMPPGFAFPVWSGFAGGAELWVPLQLPLASRDPANDYAVLGRLRENTTREEAAASLSTQTQQLRKEFPNGAGLNQSAAIIPLQESLVGSVRPALLILMAAVGLVLLIACANVANLVLSRALGRGKEIALRSALGATRRRIFRQLIVESLLLASLGGVIGILLALAGQRVLNALVPASMPQIAESRLDWRVLFFAMGVSILTGIIFALVPSVNASRTDLQQSLKNTSLRMTADGERRRISAVLIVAETALAVLLLAGAGLLLQSFMKLTNVDPGFNAKDVLTFETTLPESKYGNTSALSIFYGEALDHLRNLRGVAGAANISSLPTERGPDLPFDIEGRGGGNAQGSGESEYRTVSTDYFRTMGIPVLNGRSFVETDSEESPAVAVINETMARQFWPNQNAIGQMILIGKAMGPAWTDRPRQIVGVVDDVKEIALNQPAPSEMFIPYAQIPAGIAAFEVKEIPTRWAVRVQGDPHALISAAGQAILGIDPNVPISNVKTMDEILSDSISGWRFNLFLLGTFASLALVLGAVGLYGVLSYSVAQRTSEIGIRIALGASRADVLRLTLGEAAKLTVTGVAVGIVGAFALTRFLSSMLFGVRATDPVTFTLVPVGLFAVALIAAYIPARRAMRVDPMMALRHE